MAARRLPGAGSPAAWEPLGLERPYGWYSLWPGVSAARRLVAESQWLLLDVQQIRRSLMNSPISRKCHVTGGT